MCLDAYRPYFLSGNWTGRLSGPQNIGGKKTLRGGVLVPVFFIKGEGGKQCFFPAWKKNEKSGREKEKIPREKNK